MRCFISKITNHISWIDYLSVFGLLIVFVWKVKNGVGTIIRKITIFLLLNKWYETLLPSGCLEKGMYEPDLWGKSVCFISTPAYFCLLGMDGRRGGAGGECHSYHLTHELPQTQVDIDMLQMLVMQSDVNVFKRSHWPSFVPYIFLDCLQR